jgi:hypothetical protein
MHHIAPKPDRLIGEKKSSLRLTNCFFWASGEHKLTGSRARPAEN